MQSSTSFNSAYRDLCAVRDYHEHCFFCFFSVEILSQACIEASNSVRPNFSFIVGWNPAICKSLRVLDYVRELLAWGLTAFSKLHLDASHMPWPLDTKTSYVHLNHGLLKFLMYDSELIFCLGRNSMASDLLGLYLVNLHFPQKFS